ncbi:MAG: PolC-type DNA polymerase III [Archangium sp.]
MSVVHARVPCVAATATILGRLCFVDIETTGLDPATDQIVEIGAVFVERGLVTARRQWLVRPDVAMPAMVSALTGLDDAALRSAPRLEDIATEFANAVAGWSLVAHNGNFERSFLKELIETNPLLDSCEVAQLLFPERTSHSLDALVKWLAVGDGARHRAIDDAEDTFLMVSALCERFMRDGSRQQLDAVLEHLEPGAGADRAVLCALLKSLRDEVTNSPATKATSLVSPKWPQLQRWLSAPDFVTFELEQERIDELAMATAATNRDETPVAVAVSSASFRELSQRDDVPAIARRPLCSSVLRRELERLGADALAQFGRAYLAAWLSRTRTGEIDTLSGFVRTRVTDVAAIIEAASSCGCDDERCFTRREPASSSWVLISHEHALEWMKRLAPVRFIVVDADRLPDAERRRFQRGIELRSLERAGVGAALEDLTAALAAHPEGALTMRSRLAPAWLAVREALTRITRELLDDQRLRDRIFDVLDVPPPGFEVIVRTDSVMRVPIRPAERVLRRLRGGMCLLSSFQGGTSWTQKGAMCRPAEGGARVEVHVNPVELAALAGLLRDANANLLVAPGPIEPLVETLREQFDVSLGAQRSNALRVIEWRRETTLPPAETCVFYGVRDWRKAVLAARAQRVVLLSPRGFPAEPVQRALRGLDAVTC